MSVQREIRFDYPAPVESVVALLSDGDFLTRRCEAAGEHDVHVNVQAEQGERRIRLERRVPMDLPAFARRFITPSNRVVEESICTETPDGWQVHYTIDIQGVPAEVSGQAVFAPGPSGCRFTSTFEVRSGVPLVGGKLERVLAEGMEQGFFENAERNCDALRREGPRGA